MALIKCSECGKEISDKAKICPNCSYPLKKEKVKANAKANGKKLLLETKKVSPKIIKVLIAFCIIAFVITSAKLVYQRFEYQQKKKHEQDIISKYVGGDLTSIINKEWKTEHNEYYETYVFKDDYSCNYYKSGYTFEWKGETLPSFSKSEKYYYKVEKTENNVIITIFEIDFDADNIKEIETMQYFAPHTTERSYFNESLYGDNNRIFLPDNKPYYEKINKW